MSTSTTVTLSALKPIISSSSVVLPGTDDWSIPENVLQHPYFVEVKTSLAAALVELDQRMRQRNDHRLFTTKPARSFGGTVVPTGFV
ncbi:hypothetical protein HK096_001927, partial [Nowakowskiella sp. JEL0078]